ncbi:DNA-3-methyladenine glycosylase I [Corticibacter populi]|nr:DNA-3-methyladenine glycosylase I [Corticibacter populi]
MPLAQADPLMQAYHDTEWGVPVHDARLLWETLMLEGFQAGLSWQIILRKREAFRRAFCQFDPVQIAAFGPTDVARLMDDPGIVRARAKIEATILGARIYLAMLARGEDFAHYCWSFTHGQSIVGTAGQPSTPLCARVSRDLKRRGFKFVGPTIVHAWLQAVGIANDHEVHCFRHAAMRDGPATSHPRLPA